MSNDATKGMSIEEQLAALKAENEALKAKATKAQTISYKVSEKGALSVYGLGRFPVTLYRQQWERLLANKDEILAFITVNARTLAVKE